MPRRNTPKAKPNIADKPKSYKYNQEIRRDDNDDHKPNFKYDFIYQDDEEESKQKKAPGKHRFFDQNYQHKLYTKSEGYKIAYQLCVKFEDFKKIQRLLDVKDIEKEFEPHVLEFLDSGFLVHDGWDRFEKDLKLISTKLKKMLIKVKCVGEDFSGITDGEKDNLYIYYAKDGKSYSVDAEIFYPEFDNSLLL